MRLQAALDSKMKLYCVLQMSRELKALWLQEQMIHFTAELLRRGGPFLITMTNFNARKACKALQDPANASKNHVIHLFRGSNLITRRTREDGPKKKHIIRKHRRIYSVAGKCCNFSYYVDKTQSTPCKRHVNLRFFEAYA